MIASGLEQTLNSDGQRPKVKEYPPEALPKTCVTLACSTPVVLHTIGPPQSASGLHSTLNGARKIDHTTAPRSQPHMPVQCSTCSVGNVSALSSSKRPIGHRPRYALESIVRPLRPLVLRIAHSCPALYHELFSFTHTSDKDKISTIRATRQQADDIVTTSLRRAELKSKRLEALLLPPCLRGKFGLIYNQARPVRQDARGLLLKS